MPDSDLYEHFPIDMRVRIITGPNAGLTGRVTGYNEDDYLVGVTLDGAPEGDDSFYPAHLVLVECYADLDAWMADSDYEWGEGDPDDPSPGWYDEHGHGPLAPLTQYAAAIGALG